MRLVSFEVQTPVGPFRRIGALRGDDAEVVDLNAAYGWLLRERGDSRPLEKAEFLVPPDMLGFLKGGEESMNVARGVLRDLRGAPTGLRGETVVYPRVQVKLLAPVPRPWTIRDFSVGEEHMSSRELPPATIGASGQTEFPGDADLWQERRKAKAPYWYLHMTCYKGNPWSVVGPEDPIFWPHYQDFLDLELELGFYIGKEARDLTPEQAKECIAGYTVFIDCSGRDRREIEYLGPYKRKDFCNLMGPCMVTPDEFDEMNARAWIKVNGETWFEGNTGRDRQYTSPTVLAYASDCETIYPGDFIGLGTCGFGCSMDLKRWVKPGDHVEHGIEGIGVIKSTVVRPDPVVDWARNGIPGLITPPEGHPSRQI